MDKPFVIITRKPDREALRRCGVLPEGLFRTFDVNSNGLRQDSDDHDLPTVHLWPYDLRYDGVVDDGGEGLYKPDVPGFFGLEPPVDDTAKRHNERLIAGLLGCVMVHVVFLDERRQEKGYAHFRSFDEIVKWGQSLRKALNVRFQNEEVLQSMESVLVIVARGEQVSLRASDVERFNECVQQSRSDVFVEDSSVPGLRQRKIFRSCYFLDYNLCVRDSRELYHSAEIWDVMVGRLILAFLLSRKDRLRWWQVPGVKLWRSFECALEIDEKSDKLLVDDAMARANLAVQNLVADADAKKDLSLLHTRPGVVFPNDKIKPLEPDDEKDPQWQKLTSGGWSEYDAGLCADKTSSTARWVPSLSEIKRRFADWKVSFGQQSDTGDVKAVFRYVHLAPGNLLNVVKGLYRVLRRTSLHVDDDTHRKKLEAMVGAEKARVNAIGKVRKDAGEMVKAQKHYVGFGLAAVIVSSVCVALGASVYYLLYTLFSLFAVKVSALAVALFFFIFIALGSVAAALLMVICHTRAGNRAHSALVEESKDVDVKTVKKDASARTIVEHGMRTYDTLIMRSRLFRTWALLKRTQDILLTELQPAVARRADGEGEDMQVGQKERRSVRESFLKRTRGAFGPYRIALKEDLRTGLDRLVGKWWSENAENSNVTLARARNFSELWHCLCATDQELAGYFPARLFSREIRAFVARFTEAARVTARGFVLVEHVKELRAGLLKWYERLQDGDYYMYASGAVTGEHVNELGIDNARVYFADSNIVDMDGINQLHVSSQADQSRFMPKCDSELAQTGILSLLFQEIRVRFCSDANGDELGHLMFEAVSDLAEGQNG